MHFDLSLNIMILEDEKLYAIMIKDLLSEHYTNSNIDIFYDIDDKINIYKYDFFFLDIDINGNENKGFNFASTLQKNGIDKPIVFVTSHNEYIKQSIDYRPFKYVDKSNLLIELKQSTKVLDNYINKHNKYISLKYNNSLIRLSLYDIRCIYKERNKVIIHDKNNTYSTYHSIKSLIGDIEEYSNIFIKVNEAIYISKQYIKEIRGDTIVLDNYLEFHISRPYLKSVKTFFKGRV